MGGEDEKHLDKLNPQVIIILKRALIRQSSFNICLPRPFANKKANKQITSQKKVNKANGIIGTPVGSAPAHPSPATTVIKPSN